MKTQVTKQYTAQEAGDVYSLLNAEGKGFAIGHADQTVRDAIIDGGYYLACSFDNGIFHVTLDENEFSSAVTGWGATLGRCGYSTQGASAPSHQ